MLYNKETQTQNAEPEEPGKLINVSHTPYTCNLSKIYTWPHQLLNLMKPMKYCSINSCYIAKVIYDNLLWELDLVTQISKENCLKVC